MPDESPAKNVKELIALAKAKPEQLNFGSAGVGSQVHLAGENFADAAGHRHHARAVQGRGAGATPTSSAARSQMMVGNIAAAVGAARQGPAARARGDEQAALAQLPDVPTVAESGLPGFENTGWFGLMRAGRHAARTWSTRSSATRAKVLADPEIKAQARTSTGMAPVGNTPAEFAAAIEEESARWAQVVKNRSLDAN